MGDPWFRDSYDPSEQDLELWRRLADELEKENGGEPRGYEATQVMLDEVERRFLTAKAIL